MRIRDIPQFTRWASYSVDVNWAYLPKYIAESQRDFGLDLEPDFQREYVWTPEQKTRYVEYILRGGTSGRDIHTNHPNWNHGMSGGPYVVVDGKQRISAILGFLNNEVPIFGGTYYQDFEDRLMATSPARVRWHVNDLATREEVLQWYLDLNSGGTVHTQAELDKVRRMIDEAQSKPTVNLREDGLEAARRETKRKGRAK